MAKVSIDINANSQSVKREMTTLERFMDGVAKRLGGSFQRGGASKAVDVLTKQMQALGKATDAQVQKVNTLAAALQNVGKQMSGTQGPQLAALQKQQTALQRSFTQANTRLGVLQQLGSAAAQRAQAQAPQGQPAGGGAGAGGAVAGIVGRMGSMGGSLAEGALAALPGLGALLTVTGIASIVHKAYEESSRKEKNLADIMPRLLGPGNAVAGSRGFDQRLGRMGIPLGFTTNEGLTAAENLSTGGFKSLGGLQRDTKTSMQMARFFGLDVGQEASTLAEGGRMGAFRPGDAKKFAGMLATEISKTGLGPRAQEVQEATLMLLNNQLRTQATSSPGPIMALQTMFNKTGLPAFTGTRGAGIINQLQDSVTNPRSAAAEAMNQQVFLNMGAKNFFQMEEMKERGLADPRYLPSLIRTMKRGTGSKQEMLLGLQRQTGLPLLQLEGLDSKLPGGLSGITAGSMGHVQKLLKSGGIDISTGAVKAMGMTGNRERQAEAAMNAIMMRLGDAITKRVDGLQTWFAQHVEGALGIIDTNTKGGWDETKRLADFFVGEPVDKLLGGALSNPDKIKAATDAYAKLGTPGGALAAGVAHMVFPDAQAGPAGLLGLAHQYGLSVTSGYRSPAHNRAIGGAAHSRHTMGSPGSPGAFDFGGSPDKMGAYFDAVRQQYGDAAIAELIYSPKGMVKDGRYYAPGHFGAKTLAGHYSHVHGSLKGQGGEGDNHLTIHVQHDGIVGPHAQAQVDHAVGKAVEKAAKTAARTQPNKRNMRQ